MEWFVGKRHVGLLKAQLCVGQEVCVAVTVPSGTEGVFECQIRLHSQSVN